MLTGRAVGEDDAKFATLAGVLSPADRRIVSEQRDVGDPADRLLLSEMGDTKDRRTRRPFKEEDVGGVGLACEAEPSGAGSEPGPCVVDPFSVHGQPAPDVREDATRMSNENQAHVMATLNNFIIGLASKLSFKNLAAARRHFDAQLNLRLAAAI